MLDVASLQQFDFFSNFTLCAGADGLYRTISNVVVLDYEGIEENFCDFHKGDFVLTNLIYAKEQPEKIYSSFSQLMDIGVSAIAVKTVFFRELPDEVIRLANRQKVPLFFFDSIYIEDVILNIADYLRSNTNYTYYERLIESFIAADSHTAAIDRLLQNIRKESHPYVSAMYISYKHTIDDFSIQRSLNKMQLQKQNLGNTTDIFFTKYKKGILFLYFYETCLSSITLVQNWKRLLADLFIDSRRFHIGISDRPLPLLKTDIAIQRSLYANTICNRREESMKTYSELSLNNLILPLSDNAYVREYLSELLGLIRENDSEQHGHLLETLCAYVRCHFQITRTAGVLFQHPNTIRYRISRLKMILGIENDFEFQMLSLLITHILIRESI